MASVATAVIPTQRGGMTLDTLKEHGAKLLAKRIEKYWRAEGYHGINVRVEPYLTPCLHADQQATVYCVRSNINEFGYPPKAA